MWDTLRPDIAVTPTVHVAGLTISPHCRLWAAWDVKCLKHLKPEAGETGANIQYSQIHNSLQSTTNTSLVSSVTLITVPHQRAGWLSQPCGEVQTVLLISEWFSSGCSCLINKYDKASLMCVCVCVFFKAFSLSYQSLSCKILITVQQVNTK